MNYKQVIKITTEQQAENYVKAMQFEDAEDFCKNVGFNPWEAFGNKFVDAGIGEMAGLKAEQLEELGLPFAEAAPQGKLKVMEEGTITFMAMHNRIFDEKTKIYIDEGGNLFADESLFY